MNKLQHGNSDISLADFARVKDWLHVLGIPVLGYIIDAGVEIDYFYFFIMLLASAFVLTFAYSFNEYFDRKMKKPSNLFFSVLSLAVSLIMAISLSTETFLLVMFLGILVFAYAHPVIRLKRYPVVGTLINPVGYSTLFLVGAFSYGGAHTNAMLFLPNMFLVELAFQLIHEMTHVNEDRKMGLETTAMRTGRKRTFVMFYFILFAGILYLTAVSNASGLFRHLIYINAGLLAAMHLAVKYSASLAKARKKLRIVSIVYGVFLLYIFLSAKG